MTYSGKFGTCQFRGPPGLATPYAGMSCFQPPYSVNPNPQDICNSTPSDQANPNCNQVNCVPTWKSFGTCYYDQDCQSAGRRARCFNGRCGTFDAANPQVIKELSWNELKAFGSAMNIPIDPRKRPGFCNNPNLLLVSYQGEHHIVAPLSGNQGHGSTVPNPQCQTCLKTVWQCDRFLGTNNKRAYRNCKELSSCFLYDVVRLDGTIIPTTIKMNSKCMQVAHAALKKCASRCATCVPQDALALM